MGLSTERDCTWSIATDVGWISIAGAKEGQGEASVRYTVAPNPAPVARSGSIVAGQGRVQLNQAAAPCSYSISPSSAAVGASGGRLSFDVATLNGCSWSAAADAPWLTIASGQRGSANGTVTVDVAANGGAARVGHVAAGGVTFTVSQSASGSPTPAPPPEPPPPSDPVHLEGLAVFLSGRCPDVTFLVDLAQVVTNRDTKYDKKDHCDDIQTGRSVEVDGIDTGSAILATRINIDK